MRAKVRIFSREGLSVPKRTGSSYAAHWFIGSDSTDMEVVIPTG